MKKYVLMYLSKLLTVCLFSLVFSSCEKDAMPVDGRMSGSDRTSRASVCSAFSYADSTFYLRNQPADYVVSPTSGLAGTYSATPFGLAINPSTGAINISKSETGLTYKVYFVQTGTTDTCTRDLTISGIDFASSIHMLAQNDTVIKAIYKGSTGKVSGSFDINGLTGALPIRSLGISINPVTASINLAQTVGNGLFGIIPLNGVSRTVRLYYSFDDASQKAINHIDLRLTYYDKLSNVPASLLSKVKSQNARVGAPGSTTDANSSESTDARPPDIVIVGH